MTDDARFEVTKPGPDVWHVSDRYTGQTDVIVFPLDEVTAAHARVTVSAEYAARHPAVWQLAEDKLRRHLERAGYTIIQRRPLIDRLL